MISTVDVLVVGGGPAGATAARVLSLNGHSVILADQIQETDKVGESLPGSARPLLRELGLLTWLEKSGPTPWVGTGSFWGSEDLVFNDFIRHPHGTGWHLNRREFDVCLREAATTAGAELRFTRLVRLTREGAIWRATTDDGDLQVRWIIEASGKHAVCARMLGIKRVYEEPLIGLYSYFSTEGGDQRTLIEAACDGWWYTAPAHGGRRIACFFADKGDAVKIMKDPTGWHRRLSATKHIRLSRTGDIDTLPPCAVSAGGAHLQQTAGNGWLAVGDAAMSFDPLSSQGIFNALYTALRGAQAVALALRGENELVACYPARLRQIQQAYQRHRITYYRAEARWAQHNFWRTRHSTQS